VKKNDDDINNPLAGKRLQVRLTRLDPTTVLQKLCKKGQ